MFEDKARTLSLQLAEETKARIRDDRRRASTRVAELLEKIEESLLDPDLQVESLRRWCGQGDKNVSTHFAEEMGLAPWAYITQCRMELACQILARSDFAVWRVGLAVGYLSGKSFSRAFTRWAGQSPKAFRAEAQARAVASPDGGEEAPPVPEMLSRAELERALAGDLSEDDAQALVRRLGELRDEVRSSYRLPSPPAPGREQAEPAMAYRLWRWIERQPHEQQMAAVESQQAAFYTPALFHLLCTESIEAGAHDDVRGLNLASLALASLPGPAKRLGESGINLFARAHAVVGLAFFRSGALDDAAQAYRIATRMLAHLGESAHPVVIAELCLYQSTLELARDNVSAARKLLGLHKDLLQALVDRYLPKKESDGSPELPQ